MFSDIISSLLIFSSLTKKSNPNELSRLLSFPVSKLEYSKSPESLFEISPSGQL